MIIFFSGSSYSKLHPEREKKTRGRVSVMMTYYEIKRKVAGEHKRFAQLVRSRKP